MRQHRRRYYVIANQYFWTNGKPDLVLNFQGRFCKNTKCPIYYSCQYIALAIGRALLEADNKKDWLLDTTTRKP